MKVPNHQAGLQVDKARSTSFGSSPTNQRRDQSHDLRSGSAIHVENVSMRRGRRGIHPTKEIMGGPTAELAADSSCAWRQPFSLTTGRTGPSVWARILGNISGVNVRSGAVSVSFRMLTRPSDARRKLKTNFGQFFF